MDSAALIQPKLRADLAVSLGAGRAEVASASGVQTLSFPDDCEAPMARLVAGLREGGRTIEDLALLCPEIENLAGLIEQLDALHLLTETKFAAPVGLVSGRQLDREVRRLAARVKHRLSTSRFLGALLDATATRRQLIGYALEYYWLVRAAPALVAPALATVPSAAGRALLQDFLASELHHDLYLEAALRAAGVDDDLMLLQPLPTTFHICASLAAYAQQHPLSFQAALFLFEEPQEAFVDAFDLRCRELSLPEDFYLPLRQHSSINEDANHGAISTDLLAQVAIVDREEQIVVRRNIAVLVETMVRQEDEILDYYGDPANPLPRIFV